MRFVLVFIGWTLAVSMAACSGGGDNDGGALDASYPDGLLGDAPCGAAFHQQREDPGFHVAPGTDITWSSNPPSSGTHYPIWAHWGVHTDVVPRGYYVHNLEHGGVAILYRCDGDCSDTRARLAHFFDTLPPDPECSGATVVRRVLVTEDPLIQTPIAATAWGWTYNATCIDEPSLLAFVRALQGHGPEDLCNDGSYSP